MDKPGRQQSGMAPEPDANAEPGARRTATGGVAPDPFAQRLTSQFAPAYLTLASIIQGVALSTLVLRVEGAYAGFDAMAWLLTLDTFLTFLIVWHEYVLQVLAFVWLPTVLDTVVPFAFLAAELLLAHCVYQDLRLWLLALGPGPRQRRRSGRRARDRHADPRLPREPRDRPRACAAPSGAGGPQCAARGPLRRPLGAL